MNILPLILLVTKIGAFRMTCYRTIVRPLDECGRSNLRQDIHDALKLYSSTDFE